MSGNSEQAKLLIVEDVLFPDAEDLQEQLTTNGYDVVGIAQTTEEAVEMAHSLKPDLVLMDLKIPLKKDEAENRLGGIQAAEAIRKFADVEIIYVTAERPADDILQAVKRISPRPRFVSKPYSEPQLLYDVKLTLEERGGKVIFLSYPHSLESYRMELAPFLEPLKGFGLEPWDDKQIRFGEEWEWKIEMAVSRADVAILLINIDFVNSRFINDFELPKLLEAAKIRGLRVIPVYVGAVQESVLRKKGLLAFQGINAPEDPLEQWTRKVRTQKAWVPLCDQLTKN